MSIQFLGTGGKCSNEVYKPPKQKKVKKVKVKAKLKNGMTRKLEKHYRMLDSKYNEISRNTNL